MAESSPPRPAGVLLAAGRSRRMGSTKQLLPVPDPFGDGGAPMIVRSFDLLAGVCGGRIVVVMGHDAEAVAAALEPRSFTRAASDPDADMLVSVRAGLSRAADAFPGARAYWLHLADHPFVRSETLEAVLAEFESRAGRVAVLPTHGGRGGHPALIPAGLVADILSWRGEGGLRAFWLRHPERIARVEVNDPGVIHDLDTPQQYGAATERTP